MLEIDHDNVLQVYLNGICQVRMSNAKLPPFLVSSFLTTWNLTTNQLKFQIIGTKQSPTPYIKNLNNFIKTNPLFFDCMNCNDSVFNGDTLSAIYSSFGDIALYL